MNDELGKIIHEKAMECGFDNCGVIPIEALDIYKERLKERVEKVPESAAFYSLLNSFTKLKENYPWVNSAIVCLEYYGKYKFPKTLRNRYGKVYLLSTAIPEHPLRKGKKKFEEWMKNEGIRFEGGEENVLHGTFPLREAASAAGLGIIRKNNSFYAENGSYYELEGYLIDKSCKYIQVSKIKPCPENCNLCIKSCKTRALVEPYTMNPNSCTAFWTKFVRVKIPKHLKAEQFGEWIIGCDDCQDACPYNKHDWDIGEDFPGMDIAEKYLTPENLIVATDEELISNVHLIPDKPLTPKRIKALRECAERVCKRYQ